MDKYIFTVAMLAGCLLTGCDNFEYHPYDVKMNGPVDINMTNIRRIEDKRLSPPFKFAFITDTQGAINDMADALDIICQRGDIDFIIHGGDQTDFGLPKEFMWCRDMLEKSGIPYVAVIGNHDCLGNGADTFNYIYGAENYSFNVGQVHFVCLNTVALEYDYSHPVPDFGFIKSDSELVKSQNYTSPGSITHTVVVMHSQPYDVQFNNNVADPFNHYISQYPGMDADSDIVTGGAYDFMEGKRAKGFCLNGHNHANDVSDLFGNGILYYQCANIAKRTFFVFTMITDGYDFEQVDF